MFGRPISYPRPLARWGARALLALALSALVTTGCDSDTNDSQRDPDVGPTDANHGDVATDASADADTTAQPGSPVTIDLEPYLGSGGGGEQASVYQLESMDEAPAGAVVETRPGDWVMENGQAKFFIEADARSMSPCPFGGNVIEAVLKGDDGTEGVDMLGEICLMANVTQTFDPDSFEVLADGSDGRAAVLAVTGHLEFLDFLNVASMAADFAPGLLDNINIQYDELMPLTITVYYILQPGQTGLQAVTAIRNDGDETMHAAMGHLVRGGATGSYFNPLNSLSGWGYTSLGPDNLSGERLPFVAYGGQDGAYAYVPEPDPDLSAPLPIGGVHLSVAGVTATLFGRTDVVGALLATESQIPNLEGVLHLDPGQVDRVGHWTFVGDRSLSTMLDPIYGRVGQETGELTGRVTDADGQPVAGAMVTAVGDRDRAMNQTYTDADGAYTMRVPPGPYTVLGRLDGQVATDPPQTNVTADQTAEVDLGLAGAGELTMRVQTAAGQPTPARLTLLCEADCPYAPTSQEMDVDTDRLPDGVARIVRIGIDGEATVRVPPGDYRVVVSRGMEWSVWPQDARASGGFAVTLAPGDPVAVDAEIAHVVDSAGVLSGDFHIHSVPSADSRVRLTERVLNFASEGLDVMVSTDHDVITDFAPTIADLGLEAEITSLRGDEITTPDIGHINGFPLTQDTDHRHGGALDWGQGTGLSMTPAEIFAWIDDHPGTQVSQINHPTGTGTIGALEVDLLHGWSFADAAQKRLPDQGVDPETGDTRLWSEDFTALEMMNGHGKSNFWAIMRWWLTMIGRGFSPTATAVTDTHKLHSDLGGSPRSYVFVGDGTDTPATMDPDGFATAINDGKLIGTNGPFFRAELVTDTGQSAGLGETLDATDGAAITARITVDVPEWIPVDTVEIYSNLTDAVITGPGQAVEEPLAATSATPFTLGPDDLVEAAQGGLTHNHYVKTIEVPVDADADAYVVVVVRASAGDMWPVLPSMSVAPYAFANPIFVDVDGGGYDNPPLAELAASTQARPLGDLEPLSEAPPADATPRELLRHFVEHVGHAH